MLVTLTIQRVNFHFLIYELIYLLSIYFLIYLFIYLFTAPGYLLFCCGPPPSSYGVEDFCASICV